MKFRKKPVVIEAMQLREPNTPAAVAAWCQGRLAEVGPMGHPTGVLIDTLEGTMRADTGDWIIRGVQGEFYPCKPDIFEATYEPVPSSARCPAVLQCHQESGHDGPHQAIEVGDSTHEWRTPSPFSADAMEWSPTTEGSGICRCEVINAYLAAPGATRALGVSLICPVHGDRSAETWVRREGSNDDWGLND